jgi:NADP-dependent 3-hydroxy acid dehydrogenase YdfG
MKILSLRVLRMQAKSEKIRVTLKRPKRVAEAFQIFRDRNSRRDKWQARRRLIAVYLGCALIL